MHVTRGWGIDVARYQSINKNLLQETKCTNNVQEPCL